MRVHRSDFRRHVFRLHHSCLIVSLLTFGFVNVMASIYNIYVLRVIHEGAVDRVLQGENLESLIVPCHIQLQNLS
jgi:ABC-type protease/lipase transport system fused ATPase/permease subunit